MDLETGGHDDRGTYQQASVDERIATETQKIGLRQFGFDGLQLLVRSLGGVHDGMSDTYTTQRERQA